MKNFSRTYPGKAIAFLLCVLSLLGLIASVSSIVFLWGTDAYSCDYNTYYRENIQRVFQNDAGRYTEYIILSYPDMPFSNTSLRFGLFRDDVCVYLSDGADIDMLTNGDVLSCDVSDTVEWVYNDYEFLSPPTDASVNSVYTFRGYLDEGRSGIDNYSLIKKLSCLYYYQTEIYIICIGFGLLFFATYLCLLCASARRPNSEELYPGYFNRVPFDILFGLSAGIVLLLLLIEDSIAGVNSSLSTAYYYLSVIIYCSATCAIFSVLFVGLSMSFAARVKGRCLISGLLCFKLFALILKAIRSVFAALRSFFLAAPLIWKYLLIYMGISFFQLIIIWNGSYLFLRDWILILKVILFPILSYLLIMLNKLKQGAEALSKGDLSHHIDTSKMVLDLKAHGETLNNIGEGMTIAVEDRLKSERMKTELITNVSHDIKTPLTSIINYADLISKEECDNEKIIEYSSVLLRQSERLKRLITDLLEVSKASTGNLEVELSPADGGVMLSQLCGEYEDRLKESGLMLISKCPEEKIVIMADGRRMMRVFDNLMNNISKYALPGTRVYISLEKHGDTAVYTFKNTSRDPLNLSPDELMERFVRGDRSRHTEGNGLGLSIARSLTELQHGDFGIEIDGDLFKVTLGFPSL